VIDPGIKMDTTYVVEADTSIIISSNIADFKLSEPMKYVFYDASKECGKFWFDKGIMHFEGNADKSARAFFTIFKQQVDEYVKTHIDKSDVETVIVESIDTEEPAQEIKSQSISGIWKVILMLIGAVIIFWAGYIRGYWRAR
jgi:hypothetical protein